MPQPRHPAQPSVPRRAALRFAVAGALSAMLAACGGGGGAAAPSTPTPPTITLSAAASQILAGGQAVPLSATVSSAEAPSWQLAAGAPGSLSAASGATVNYVPPASVAAITQVAITASAGGASKSLTLTLYPDPGAPGLSLLAGGIGGNSITDGVGTAARFSSMAQLVADTQGNYYAADRDATRHAVRRIDANRVVSTIYSSTDANNQDGVYSVAAVDGAVYVLEQPGAKRLRRIAPSGAVTELLAGSAALARTVRLAAGAGGAVYLLGERSIALLGADGGVTLLAGDENATPQNVDGQGAAVRFMRIRQAASVPDGGGQLLILDSIYPRTVTPAGVVATITPRDEAGQQLYPDAVAAAPGGVHYLLAPARRVLQMTAAGLATLIYEEFPASGWGGAALPVRPVPIHLTAGGGGKLLLASPGEIRQLSNRQSLHFAGLEDNRGIDVDGVGGDARFTAPHYLAADRQGKVYVIDYPGRWPNGYPVGLYLRRIAPAGQVSTLVKDAAFGRPGGLAVDPAGNLYVSEMLHPSGRFTLPGGAVHKITPAGTVTLLAGRQASLGSSLERVDGAGASARFLYPELAGIDPDGNVYVRDGGYGTLADAVRRIAPNGDTTTIASLPAGLNAAPDGHAYAAEGDTVVRVAADGARSVVAGVPGKPETVLGALPGGLRNAKAVAPIGPHSFAVISGEAILKLELPH